MSKTCACHVKRTLLRDYGPTVRTCVSHVLRTELSRDSNQRTPKRYLWEVNSNIGKLIS
jgi:hypothetical protein